MHHRSTLTLHGKLIIFVYDIMQARNNTSSKFPLSRAEVFSYITLMTVTLLICLLVHLTASNKIPIFGVSNEVASEEVNEVEAETTEVTSTETEE